MLPENGANENAAPQDAPRYLTYPELREYGIGFSRKHLLDLMRAGKFPQARQLSANRVAWLRAEILAYCQTRPVARLLGTAAPIRRRPSGGESPQTKSARKFERRRSIRRRMEAVVQHIIAHAKAGRSAAATTGNVPIGFSARVPARHRVHQPEYKAATKDPRLNSTDNAGAQGPAARLISLEVDAGRRQIRFRATSHHIGPTRSCTIGLHRIQPRRCEVEPTRRNSR
jgi:predicted DNA-binding transcriptional regulator AlpA